MKTLLCVLVVVAAGLAGLAFVFTDVLVVPPGPVRIAVAGLFYVAVGLLLAALRPGGSPFRWAVASGWGTAILGLVGLWVSITDAGSGDLALALIFLFGPALAAGFGGWIGVRAFGGRASIA